MRSAISGRPSASRTSSAVARARSCSSPPSRILFQTRNARRRQDWRRNSRLAFRTAMVTSQLRKRCGSRRPARGGRVQECLLHDVIEMRVPPPAGTRYVPLPLHAAGTAP